VPGGYNLPVEQVNDTHRFEHSVAVIGAGKVGQALASLLRKAGADITTVTARSPEAAEAAALATGGRATTDNASAARSANVVLVTVGDDALATVVQEVADAGGWTPGQAVVHASGVYGLEPLASAAEVGAHVACAHPLQSFANAHHAIQEIPGTVFGVTANEDSIEIAVELVRAVGGVPVEVAGEAKALYHAAATVASNHLVALEDIATEMFVRSGMPADVARDALWPLLRGTVTNVRRFGTRQALTGPVVRGDIDTVRRHLAAIDGLPALYRSTYRDLAAHAVEMAVSRGDIDEAAALEFHRLLGGEQTP
jgi:predicted short-subunit dehydrogenase-like oxidoreductase (DUF2520 family)